MKKRIVASVLSAALCPSIAVAATETLSDGVLDNLVVYDFGVVYGAVLLDGAFFGSIGPALTTNCGPYSNQSAISGTDESRAFSAECGIFDVDVTARMLSPLPSATTLSTGFEVEFKYTNTTLFAQPLSHLHNADDDIGTLFGQNVIGYDTSSATVWIRDTESTPDNFLAVTASTDDPTATYGFDVDTLGMADTTFPLEGGVGPVGPTDVAWTIGFQTTVAPGASVTFRFRTLLAQGITSVPADFDFSSCYTIPAIDCTASNKGLLSFKDDSDDTKDKLIWKFLNGDATTQDDFGNPAGTADFSLCIYDGNGDRITSFHVPASSDKWSPVTTMGYKYLDDLATAGGVSKCQLKGGAAGKSKITLLAKGENLPDPTLGALATPIRVQMNSGGAKAKCFNTSLATTVSNLTTLLKAKAP